MSFAGLMNTTCDIERPTRTSDGMGGYVLTWVAAFSGVPCRLFEVDTKEQVMFGREGVRVSHRLYMEHFAGLLEDDTVLIGAERFAIKGIKPMAGTDRFLQLVVDRVSG